MPIQMRRVDGLNCPQVICDGCDEPIQKDGNVVWSSWLEERESEVPRFYHKDCDPRADTFWQELDVFLFYLGHNSKADLERARKSAEFFAGIA